MKSVKDQVYNKIVFQVRNRIYDKVDPSLATEIWKATWVPDTHQVSWTIWNHTRC